MKDTTGKRKKAIRGIELQQTPDSWIYKAFDRRQDIATVEHNAFFETTAGTALCRACSLTI